MSAAGRVAATAAPPPSILRRYRDVAAVLVRHGLADVAQQLHLLRPAGPMSWGSRLLPARARPDPSLSRAARFRLTLEELGPTFVKFGQALSVRADLLPGDLIAELATLQDHVAPLAPGDAERAFEFETGRSVASVFRAFDAAPVASASIAQVHAAVLPSGDEVVVKIRRPGIERTIAGDVEMLRQLARLVEHHVPAAEVVNPPALVDEFARSIRLELNLVREARNIERVARQFEDDASVRCPRVHWPLTTPGVLTMERLTGWKVSELDAAGLGPVARALVARRGADAVLAQILVHGFFHADPHPGNLLVLPPDHAIGLIDFGIVGQIDARARRDLARIIRAIWQRDAAALAALALEVTEPRGEVDARALERDLAALIELYGDVPLAELSATEVLNDIVGTAARHRLAIPSHLMLLIKALVTIEGVGRQLDPSFKVVEHAAPVAERLWRAEFAPDALARQAVESVMKAGTSIRALPGHLEAIGRKIRDGRLEIRFVHRNLEHFVREMDRSSNRLAFAMIIASLIVGSSLVIQAGQGATLGGYPLLGLAGFIVAGVFGVGLAIGVVRSGRL